MNDLWQFLSAVGRHWFSWVIGAVVAAIVRLWPMVGDGNPPRWLFWTAVWIGLFFAAFFAWREERKRADALADQLKGYESRRPEAVLRLLVDGTWLLLEVRNDGASGQFTATIETDGGPGGRALPPVPAIWDLTNNHQPVELRPVEAARLRIGTVDEDRTHGQDPEDGSDIPPNYGWKLPFHQPEGLRGWYGGRRDLDEPDAEWFIVKIVVRSLPELEGNLVVKRVRLVGRYAVDPDSGERLEPIALVHDYDDGY